MVLGYFEEKKMFDFIIVGGRPHKGAVVATTLTAL
jgi:hypothetical protein